MTNDTKNSLEQFDICVAIAQRSLNSQIQAAWVQWLSRSEFSDTPPDPKDFTGEINIYPPDEDGEPSSLGLTAKLAPLSVNLNVENSKLAQVEVTLHIESGSVTYFTGSKIKTLAIKDWSISFLTNLEKQPIDWEALKAIDPAAHYTAEQMVANADLPPSVFSIEYLVMEFSKAELVSNAVVKVPDVQPPDVQPPDAAKTQVKAMLNLLTTGKTGQYMLGTVVRRSTTRGISVPTFALTSFIFDIKADPVPWASTLSYLGMFSRNPLPDNIDTARIALQDNWVRPEMLDGRVELMAGVMVISKHTLVDNYLIPLFTSALQVAPEIAGSLKWTYKNARNQPNHYKDVIWHNFDIGWNWQIDIEILPGSNQLSISGRVNSYVNYEGRTLDMGPFGGDDRTEGLYNEGHQDVKATLVLTGTGGALDFKIAADIPEDDYFSQVFVDRHETFGFSKVTEAIGSALKGMGIIGNTPGEMLDSASKAQLANLTDSLRNALRKIDIQCNEHSFIPPGGGEFTFQNLRFSNAGDAILDILYQAPQ